MSIKSELSILKTNIQNAKDKLYSNLTDKGVTTITTASTLDAMADSVSGITTGGGNPFEIIGYSKTPKNVQDDIDYSITIQDNWDASITSCNEKFKEDEQLVYFPLVDTSNVTGMSYMFDDCVNLQSVPQINTSNVTNMSWMFHNCDKLTSLQISSFDTSNVTDMSYMFAYCEKLTSLNISGWDTSNVAYMRCMFNFCNGLISLDISGWDTSNVIDMQYMFQTCSGLTELDLSNFNTSNVTNMSYMFAGNNLYRCNKFNNIILPENFGSACTNMSGIFSSNSGFTSLDLSNINTSNVTNMSYMFAYCEKLTSLEISSFDTSNVTDMSSMFNGCSKLTEIHWNNFGNGSGYTAVSFSNSSKLGVNTTDYPNAKQSIVNTFITNSYDRATAGYSTCTVTLSTNTKAVLTDDEIAQITAKGFTIA